MPTVTTTRAVSTVDTDTGASRIRRSTCFLRQLTSVSAAPNTAVTATPHDMMPGVMYWIGLSEESSTLLASIVYLGGWPVACWFTWLTTPVHDAGDHAGLRLVALREPVGDLVAVLRRPSPAGRRRGPCCDRLVDRVEPGELQRAGLLERR